MIQISDKALSLIREINAIKQLELLEEVADDIVEQAYDAAIEKLAVLSANLAASLTLNVLEEEPITEEELEQYHKRLKDDQQIEES